jgi:hypothetical protein
MEDKKDAAAPAGDNMKFYEAMAKLPEGSDPGMVTAKSVAILHAAIRRIPEQTWPRSSQQDTTHRYI